MTSRTTWHKSRRELRSPPVQMAGIDDSEARICLSHSLTAAGQTSSFFPQREYQSQSRCQKMRNLPLLFTLRPGDFRGYALRID